MIRVTFIQTYDGFPWLPPPPPIELDADDVTFYSDNSFAVFHKYIPVEGEKWKDTKFVRAIRMDQIEEIEGVEINASPA